MSTIDQVTIPVRAVTDEEIQTFWEKGWVKLPRLIDSDAAASLLERAKQRMEGHEMREGVDLTRISFFRDYHYISHEDELFRSLATNSTMGRNTSQLLGRDMGIRLASDSLAVKMPIDEQGHGSSATNYHQDYPYNAIDRASLITWIALDTITPEHGAMRFYEGSQSLGSLGLAHADAEADGLTLADRWPRLGTYPLSEPQHYAPGDASVHSSLVVHGAPANTTDTPRWAYILSYYPANARYTSQPSDALGKMGFEPFQIIDHPELPVIYDPAKD